MFVNSKVKAVYLWFGFLVLLGLGIGLIHLINNKDNQTPLLILAAIVFIAMTICLQTAMAKTFKYRPKKEKFIERKFIYPNLLKIEEILNKNKFQKRTAGFGYVFTKVIEDVCYKVTLIKDCDLYFNNKETSEVTPTKGIEKCTKLIGFELFYQKNEEIMKKTPDFSFQGNNILYQGYYYDAELSLVVEPNVLIVNEMHKEAYNYLKELLELNNEVINNESEVQ